MFSINKGTTNEINGNRREREKNRRIRRGRK
jgi:hypothetical protein